MADVEDRLGNSAAAEDYRRRARLAVERFGARGGEGPMESESGRRSLDEP
jgi:hypothetical protein